MGGAGRRSVPRASMGFRLYERAVWNLFGQRCTLVSAARCAAQKQDCWRDPQASGISVIAEQRGRILRIQRDRDIVVIEDRGLKHIREEAEARIADLEAARSGWGANPDSWIVMTRSLHSARYPQSTAAGCRQACRCDSARTSRRKGFDNGRVTVEWR